MSDLRNYRNHQPDLQRLVTDPIQSYPESVWDTGTTLSDPEL